MGFWVEDRRFGWLCLIFFISVLFVLGVRSAPNLNVAGNTDRQKWVLQDFRDAIYYPVKSYVEGRNPYDERAHLSEYPVVQPFSPYSPLFLLVHTPFAALPHGASQIAYVLVSIALILVLSHRVTKRLRGRALRIGMEDKSGCLRADDRVHSGGCGHSAGRRPSGCLCRFWWLRSSCH